MKSRLLWIALLAMAFTVPTYAFHCPVDMAAIDAALKAGAKLSADQLAEVKRLRADGERLHNSGKHAEAVEALGKAKKILGIN